MNIVKQLTVAAGLCCGLVAPAAHGATITVNDGSAESSYVPFHFYYLDNASCRSQVIYPASQLQGMEGNAIREIQFYLNDSGYEGDWSTTDMRVSFGEYDQTVFSTTDGSYTEFLDVPHVAYSGAMSGEAGGRLLTFKLSSPYVYTGSNLVMQISLGASSSYTRATFVGVNPDRPTAAYTTYGSSTYASNFLPKTTFTYGEQAQYEASVNVTELSFPTQLIGSGSSAQATVTVTNSGAQALGVAMTAPAAPFAATLPAATLASGASMDIPVTFTPSAAGDFTGQLTLDLGQAGTFTVDLSGKAMTAPDGYTATFNVPSRTLPEGWTGWLVTDTYDYSEGEYRFLEAKASAEYFVSKGVADIAGLGIDESNPIRDYPNRHTAYMISPAVEGDVMLSLAWLGTYGNDVSVYQATELADGSWSIGTAPLPFTWLNAPGQGWGFMAGNAAEPMHLAVVLSNAIISTFAAETAAGDVGQEYAATVTPEAIDFGTVITGHSASRQVQVLNTGRKPFDLSVNSGNDGTVTTELSAATVAAGATATITVTVAPVEAGAVTRQLTVDMGPAGTATVDITATAVAAQVGAEFEVGGITYVILSDSEAGVSSVSSSLTECEIPATVENADGIIFDVVSVEREAFYFSNVTKVTLPESVRTIGYGAFRQSPLAEINLPAGLTTIGDYAFRTTQLTSVVIPDGVTVLGSSVFGQCENLTHVTLPANLTSIGSGAFYKSALTSIDIPASCRTIDVEAFEECKSLTEVNLPEGLTEISSMLFLGCTSLTDITIPSTVTEIKTRAFEECGFTTLNIPASVTSIASSVFNGTPVATITVDGGNTAFKVVDGALYSADGSFLYLSPRTGLPEEVAVADGTRGIIGGAFYEADMKKVTLPESMEGIDEYAFCLSALEQINLPDNIFLINSQAFAGTHLTDVVLPASLIEISDGMLARCRQLTTVTIPASVTLIGNLAFYDCTALTEIIAQGETPAEFDAWDGMSEPFYNVDCSKVTVYCPDGEEPLAAYKASEWSEFFTNIKNISERPGSGIDGVAAADITVAGGDNLTVSLGTATADIEICSVAGQLLRRMAAATGTVILTDLPSGVCIVAVTTADGRRTTLKAVVK